MHSQLPRFLVTLLTPKTQTRLQHISVNFLDPPPLMTHDDRDTVAADKSNMSRYPARPSSHADPPLVGATCFIGAIRYRFASPRLALRRGRHRQSDAMPYVSGWQLGAAIDGHVTPIATDRTASFPQTVRRSLAQISPRRQPLRGAEETGHAPRI